MTWLHQNAAKMRNTPQDVVYASQSLPYAGLVFDAKRLEKLHRLGIHLAEWHFSIGDRDDDLIGGLAARDQAWQDINLA